MRVPGAENPDKVKNIVAGQGAMQGLRMMYGRELEEMGVRWVGDGEGEQGEQGAEVGREKEQVGEVGERGGQWVWVGDGQGVLEVSCAQ